MQTPGTHPSPVESECASLVVLYSHGSWRRTGLAEIRAWSNRLANRTQKTGMSQVPAVQLIAEVNNLLRVKMLRCIHITEESC